MRLVQYALCAILSLLLVSCASDGGVYAPVTDATTIDTIPPQGTYRVMPGDTLYSIAWRYGLDYRALASQNHLASPYSVRTGQVLYLRAKSSYIKATPLAIEKNMPTTLTAWQWPAKGQIIGAYSDSNKGINIAGRLGDPIYATAAGKVVYCGHGLRGYGNLIIIKHNSHYLTAYAHNSVVYVKADDWVTSGQKIAKMGNTGTQRVMLHFEIRRDGKPENPMYVMPARF